MQDIHDPRRIPLDPQPESWPLLGSIRFWLTFGKQRADLALLPAIALACVAIVRAVAVLA
ncbi:hypothetical protein [Arenimonas alkanexedens]